MFLCAVPAQIQICCLSIGQDNLRSESTLVLIMRQLPVVIVIFLLLILFLVVVLVCKKTIAVDCC